jgi:hypothetical protein
MAEHTPELSRDRPSFEQSRNLRAVVQATVEATQKIGAAIAKVTKDIVGMIFK